MKQKVTTIKSVRPHVPIEIGGAQRTLIFDFNAFAELEDFLGTLHSRTALRKLVRASLYAGLLRETLDADDQATDATLSFRRIGELLEGETTQRLVEYYLPKIKEAQGLAVGDAGPRKAQVRTVEASTGLSSGPSLDTTSDSTTPNSGD